MERNQLHFFTSHGLSWNLGPRNQRDIDYRTDAEAVVIRMGWLNLPKDVLRRSLQLHQDLGGSRRQVLARPDVDGHIRPPPGVNTEFDRREGLDLRIRRHPLLLAIATVLAAHHIGRIKRAYGLEDPGLLVTN